MDINKVLTEYDNMFGVNSTGEIEKYLWAKLDEAFEEKDFPSALSILNELMGFCRDTGQREKGIRCCSKVMDLMADMRLDENYEYATVLLNVANAYRAFGYFRESGELYEKVEKIYREKLPEGEFNYASLYNNWALLCQETEDFEDARKKLEKALSIADRYPGAVIEQATTRTNLAVTLIRLNQEEEAEKCLKKALMVYEADGGKNYHYSGALSAMGDICFVKKEYSLAAGYYEKAMKEIEKHVGKTIMYKRVEDKLIRAEKMFGNTEPYANNMERCRAFYEKYGKKMIDEKFSEYASRIAVGLVGEGSECFGYDDDISKDHDYGVGFCMWLSDEDYEEIGSALLGEYEKLLSEHGKEFITVNESCANSAHLDERRGVFAVKGFYGKILGKTFFDIIDREEIKKDGRLNFDDGLWMSLDEDKLATAVNGEVFRDDAGVFSAIRNSILAYYPKNVWYAKLADSVHAFSQNGQYNYPRMMARKDYVTAGICVNQAIMSALKILYLLKGEFAPYYKWMWKGVAGEERFSQITELIGKISLLDNQKQAWDDCSYNPYETNIKDEIVAGFETLSTLILEELKKQKIVTGNDTFLDIYSAEIAKKGERYMDRETLVKKIAELEWQQFDKVKNEGGRADCQDDFNTFSIMRTSQYNAWTDELLESYLEDLLDAMENGWNLIMEKYARMMASTAPEKYEELKDSLPERSVERIAIQEEIIKIQVEWMEEFAGEYPKMASNSRSIRTEEDTPYNTSYETYLRGEIGTYSEKTLLLYGRFVVDLQRKGENLAYNIMNNTALLYGYESAEDAEKKLS